MITRRFQLGYDSAMSTYRGSFINHGEPIDFKFYGKCTPERFADTYWYIRGWNTAVAEVYGK